MYQENIKAVIGLIEKYCKGVFEGNVGLLKEVFHPSALLVGDIDGVPYFKTVAEYTDAVKSRKSPHELGETFRSKVLAIEIVNNIATVRLSMPMFTFNYADYLSFSKIDDKWVIVHKLFTNNKAPENVVSN